MSKHMSFWYVLIAWAFAAYKHKVQVSPVSTRQVITRVRL